jgi:diaminohydroxyphosphoribosylaminopyrimidine deaminase/5-amino-6-(5-phosphoribosylamino)uracil reductase
MSNFNHFDERFMRKAISLAKLGAGSVAPNPMVGCVITRDNKIISEGFHEVHGSHHAEINAINKALESGDDLRGATLYCSLEPCCHTKKITGPCTERIKQYEFERIVVGCLDPNPNVAGNGVKALIEAGYKVESGLLKNECEDLIRIFRKNILESMPYILLKSAITLDGKIANSEDQSQWITDKAARKEAHVLRKELGAILVGRGTLEKDNPSLTIRHVSSPKGMKRILVGDVDKLEKPVSEYKLFEDQKNNPTIVVTPESSLNSPNVSKLKDLGVQVIFSGPMGPFSNPVLSDIYGHGVTSILVEGGAQLMSSLIKTGNYDELCLFVAPFMIGNGKSFYGNSDIVDINEIPRLRLESSEKIGDQLLLKYLR